MKPNALALALLTASAALPTSARAADDFCSRLIIYAFNQFCQLLPSGQTYCQPIGLAGPAPGCEVPGEQSLFQVPMGPPSIQMPTLPSFAFGSNSYSAAPNPVAPFSYPQFPYPQFSYPQFPAAQFPGASFPTQPATAFSSPVLTLPPLPLPSYAAPQVTPPQSIDTATSEQIEAAAVVQPLTKLMPVPASIDAANTDKSKDGVTAAPPSEDAPPVSTPPGDPLGAASPVAVADTESASTPTAASTVDSIPTDSVKSSTTSLEPTRLAEEAPKQAASGETSREPGENLPASANVDAPAIVQKTAAVMTTDKATDIATDVAAKDTLAHFDFDSAELTESGRAMLDAWITESSDNLPIRVTGHADRLGPEPYNEQLSLLRALAVKKYLTEKGISQHRIQLQAQGEAMPVISCSGGASPQTIACLAPNRRAEVIAKPQAQATDKALLKTANYPATKAATKRVVKVAQPKPFKPAR